MNKNKVISNEKNPKFSIRKLSLGTVSVMIGLSFLGAINIKTVKADTINDAKVVATNNGQQDNKETEQHQIRTNNIDIPNKDVDNVKVNSKLNLKPNKVKNDLIGSKINVQKVNDKTDYTYQDADVTAQINIYVEPSSAKLNPIGATHKNEFTGKERAKKLIR